ncbi:hypothetical protein KC359_g174 [Hortaea werneckii]|nr:hypothetical protein KC359_g174 [Hortaea werneckii]
MLSLQNLMKPSTGPLQTTKNRFGLDAVCITNPGSSLNYSNFKSFNLSNQTQAHPQPWVTSDTNLACQQGFSGRIHLHLMSPRFSVAPNLVNGLVAFSRKHLVRPRSILLNASPKTSPLSAMKPLLKPSFPPSTAH